MMRPAVLLPALAAGILMSGCSNEAAVARDASSDTSSALADVSLADASLPSDMKGVWQSEDDPLAFVRIADGMFKDIYDGEVYPPQPLTRVDTCPDRDDLSGEIHFTVGVEDESGEPPLCYMLVEASPDRLVYSFMPMGNRLYFQRIAELPAPSSGDGVFAESDLPDGMQGTWRATNLDGYAVSYRGTTSTAFQDGTILYNLAPMRRVHGCDGAEARDDVIAFEVGSGPEAICHELLSHDGGEMTVRRVMDGQLLELVKVGE